MRRVHEMPKGVTPTHSEPSQEMRPEAAAAAASIRCAVKLGSWSTKSPAAKAAESGLGVDVEGGGDDDIAMDASLTLYYYKAQMKARHSSMAATRRCW